MVLSGTVPQLTTSTYRRYSLVWTTQDVENHKPIRNMIYIKKKWWVFPHLGTHRQEDHLSTKCGDVVGKWYQKYARRWGHHPVWMVENNRHMEVSWNGGTPSYHPFIDGRKSLTNKPSSYWDTPIIGNPHIDLQTNLKLVGPFLSNLKTWSNTDLFILPPTGLMGC